MAVFHPGLMLHGLAAAVARHPLSTIAAAVVIGFAYAGFSVGWINVLSTPDQRGRWLLEHGRAADAAAAFRDPIWRGVALFRAGQFKDAAQVFGGFDTAEAAYNHGNALVMLGQYEDAVARYSRALELRPGWADAEANRTLARLRADRMKTTGGDMGDTDSKPDQVVFDKNKPGEGKDEEMAGAKPMSDEAVRALWLRRVQTRPADFLRAKFMYQLQSADGSDPAGAKP
jgi:Ca-activated chloride channel family protein